MELACFLNIFNISTKITNEISTIFGIPSFFTGFYAFSQQTQTGPIIQDYGAVWEIESPDFATDKSQEFKVVFDVKVGPESDTEVNRNLNTVARFLNMHAQHGVPASQLKVALIVHGTAARTC